MIEKKILKLYYYLQRVWLKFALRDPKQEFKRSINGTTFTCNNKWAYLSALQEIYLDECYSINPKISIKKILDIGANFGFSVAYFKNHFPHSEIIAFEADRDIFRYLEMNIEKNSLPNVKLFNGAAWIENGFLSFHQDFSQGGSIRKSAIHKSVIDIKSFDLRDLTKENNFDLLKMDIEGSEVELIEHISADLKQFKLIFIEYHESRGEVGKLSRILKVLEDNGFKYSFSKIYGTESLFRSYISNSAFDYQLNIFAARADQLSLLSQ